jgi:hypothetical protein
MSLYQLKEKLLTNLKLLTGIQIYPFIPLHINLKKLNDLEAFKETANLIDELYGALENPYLAGEDSYPIVAQHIKELMPEVESNKSKILTYLSNYKISHDETGINPFLINVTTMEKAKPKGFANPDVNTDFEMVTKYLSFDDLYKRLNKFLSNLNFLYEQLEMKTKRENKQDKILENKFPPLPDCFIDPADFKKYFHAPQIADIYEAYDDGTFHLKKGKKSYLACIAQRMSAKGKLIEEIKSNQDLAKVFCPYFNVDYDDKHEKQFEPKRANQVKREFYDFVMNLIK